MAAGTGTQKELCVQIVDLQPGDLPAVRALELECFSDAWSEKLLQDLLLQCLPASQTGHLHLDRFRS